MRTFRQLLPYRLKEALACHRYNSWEIRRYRNQILPTPVYEQNNKRVLFVDVSVIFHHDAGTGIQRVVRSIAYALKNYTDNFWDIRFVAAKRKNGFYEVKWPEDEQGYKTAIKVEASSGNIFLGLDYALDAIRQNHTQLRQFKRQGGKICFLVHDLLPHNHPDWFSQNTVIRYRAWLRILAQSADAFLCNSPQTQEDLKIALTHGYATHTLPMGHDILLQKSQKPPMASRSFAYLGRYVLMVGTLEPRKGHKDVIDAFDYIWEKGIKANLVIVGKLGWKVDELHNAITSHPLYKKHLWWLNDIHDDELDLLYQHSKGVIVASHAEGYGLPIIEALGHGKPTLARDIPIFRMHEAAGVKYFPQSGCPKLTAQSILDLLEGHQTQTTPVSSNVTTWQEAADSLLQFLETL